MCARHEFVLEWLPNEKRNIDMFMVTIRIGG